MRPKREAKRRIADTLEALRGAPASGKAPLLLAWQRDSAILWGLSHAAPAPSAVPDPEWSGLWGEADRFLYSTDKVLPGDWIGRAQSAAAKKRVGRFSPARLFLPSNAIPLMALLLASGATRLCADTAATYRSGDFPAAEKAWGAQVAADPLDWAARHNLSLALAQQDRWGEAAAQAAAAFVQHPSDPRDAQAAHP